MMPFTQRISRMISRFPTAIAIVAAALLAAGCSGSARNAGVAGSVTQGVAQGAVLTAAESAVVESAGWGDEEAQVTLGWMYEIGRGVAGNPFAAAHWYRMAAEQGNALGQYALAELYISGSGVGRDPAAAARWYRMASDQGHALSRYRLGNLYEKGLGVPLDYSAAAKMYASAGKAWNDAAALPPGTERVVGHAPRAPVLIPPPGVTPFVQAPVLLPPPGVARFAQAPALLPPPGVTPFVVSSIAPLAPVAPGEEPEILLASGPGTYWVHLASFRKLAGARAAIDDLKRDHGRLFGAARFGLSRVDLGAGKGIWLRVRAGPFADRAGARALCRKLAARDAYCATLSE